LTELSSGGVAEPEIDDSNFTMKDWLNSAAPMKSLRRGEVVEGTIMGIQRDGVLVDMNAKSEGLIPANEMHSLGAAPLTKVAVGEKVLVYVMQPEADQGHVLLSIDKARGERGWRVLQTRFEENEAFEAEVTGYNKGGLLVNVEGVHAFVPLSQVVGVRPEQEGEGGLASAVGKSLRLKVIEINRRRNRVILSERAALQEWRSQQKDRLLSELKEGEIRKGRVSSVRSFGVFIDLGGADGLAHLSEVSWDRNRTPEDMYKIGDEVDVFVMKVDPDTKKIALSLRRAQPEAWDEIVDKYQVGRVVPGMVTKLVTFGAFARIEGPVEGLIHVSELVDRRIAHPKEVVREGDLLPLKIVRIERDRHRLGLSLRDARDEGVRMGFSFSEAGEVIEVPEDLRREFEEREGIVVRGARPLGPADDTRPADDGASAGADADVATAAAEQEEPSTEITPPDVPAAAEPEAAEPDTGQDDQAAE
jgi:small subunit ribosomal protein S1